MPASSLMSALNNRNNNHNESRFQLSSENNQGRHLTIPDSTADRDNAEMQNQWSFQDQFKQVGIQYELSGLYFQPVRCNSICKI